MGVWEVARSKRGDRSFENFDDRVIEIEVVGSHCIYINDHRSWGGKPVVRGDYERTVRKTKVSDVLDAFSEAEIEAYLKHKIADRAYYEGLRNYRDSLKEQSND